jgi:hypothetical protein
MTGLAAVVTTAESVIDKSLGASDVAPFPVPPPQATSPADSVSVPTKLVNRFRIVLCLRWFLSKKLVMLHGANESNDAAPGRRPDLESVAIPPHESGSCLNEEKGKQFGWPRPHWSDQFSSG